MRFIILLFVFNWFSHPAHATIPSLDDIYIEAYQVAAEIQLIKKFYDVKEEVNVPDVSIEMAPKYNWQKSYEIFYKLNIFRNKLGLSVVGVPSRESQLELPPQIRYEQMLRVMTEVQILKGFLDISETVSSLPVFKGKTPTDVYNVLNRVSFELDLINGKTLTPSDTLSQAMRVSEDINFILDVLNVKNNSIPPPKNSNIQPIHVLDSVFLLLEEIKRVQKMAGLTGIDFYRLKPVNRTVTSSDVFSILGIALAELQQIKAYLGLKHALTPMAEHYEGIRTEDVQQVIGWNIRKLQALHSIKQ